MKVYIPLNDIGIEELNECKEITTNNLKIYTFSSEDYFFLESKEYFNFLNVECDCLIDLYEETDIVNSKLNFAIEITKILKNNSNDLRFIALLDKFIEIFNIALNNHTFVNIYCYGSE